MNGLSGPRWRLSCALVLLGSLAALAPRLGDLGLTYDEPAYRYSQEVSAQWWARLARVRSSADLQPLLEPDTLLYYWPYARHGINFHPPLAGQGNLLTYALTGGWLKDIPARRLATALECALTVTMLFGFLARRSGFWTGFAAAAALLVMPRVFGQALLIETDTPGMMIWTATAFAFWNGLHQPRAGRWRVAVGVLVGLAFLEKMATVFVLGPILTWLGLGHLPRVFRRDAWREGIDGLVTTALLAAPLAVAFLEILRLARALPQPMRTDLFRHPVSSDLPGLILVLPLGIWLVRRLVGCLARSSRLWGTERPALETWQAILAFAPAVAWIGNPAWWRETFPRLAHYYLLNTDRRGSLPDIRILYLGEVYEFSLPWHNGWVLIGVTVPLTLLAAAAIGLVFLVVRLVHRDRLPLFLALNLVTIPALRMLPTPAHDGVRLMLPTFVFLAALAGCGMGWIGAGLSRLVPDRLSWLPRAAVAAGFLIPAAWQLVRIHPYELSYYNGLVGGPADAHRRGFELSYWYDAFNPPVLRELERRLPEGAAVTLYGELSHPTTFQELQALGELRADLAIDRVPDGSFPYIWLLTHDSKAEAFTQLLAALEPCYASRPEQLAGARVIRLLDPAAVSRAWALKLLTVAHERQRPRPPVAPEWVHRFVPWLGRFWGEGLTLAPRPALNQPILDWAAENPESLVSAAQDLADGGENGPQAQALRRALPEESLEILLRNRPEALVEAARILVDRGADLRSLLQGRGYAAADRLGQALDASLNQVNPTPRPSQPAPSADAPRDEDPTAATTPA